jgi:hypothetical protein
MGDGQFEIAKGVMEATADVLGVGAGYPLGLEPVTDLKVGDDQGAGAPGDGDRIADVVAVSVGDQDVVGFHRAGGDGGAGVAGEEWVHQYPCASDIQSKGRVPVPGQFDSHVFFLPR